jgi:hypothetical protein
MEASNHTSIVGVTESSITKLPRPAVDSATEVATRSIGPANLDSEFGDDVIRIRLVFDGDNLRQILMVDPEQHEVEWVRAGAQPEMRNSA